MNTTKPNEITEEVLRHRIAKAYAEMKADPDSRSMGEVEDEFYRLGKFSDFIGVVGKATSAERHRAAQTCRRLGHTQTAQVILNGK